MLRANSNISNSSDPYINGEYFEEIMNSANKKDIQKSNNTHLQNIHLQNIENFLYSHSDCTSSKNYSVAIKQIVNKAQGDIKNNSKKIQKLENVIKNMEGNIFNQKQKIKKIEKSFRAINLIFNNAKQNMIKVDGKQKSNQQVLKEMQTFIKQVHCVAKKTFELEYEKKTLLTLECALEYKKTELAVLNSRHQILEEFSKNINTEQKACNDEWVGKKPNHDLMQKQSQDSSDYFENQIESLKMKLKNNEKNSKPKGSSILSRISCVSSNEKL